MIDRSRRTRLRPGAARHFPGDTLFERIARVVCAADCLPRKELYESWELARRVRRRLRGGRVVDLACGHGLVGHLMLVLDDTSEGVSCVDARLPESAAAISRAMVAAWPRLEGRVTLEARPLEEVPLSAGELVVSAHACGALTDVILSRAIAARASVAVMPCCHDEETCDAGGLAGWMDLGLAIDATRARRLAEAGYRVHTHVIPGAITAKNRVLVGEAP